MEVKLNLVALNTYVITAADDKETELWSHKNEELKLFTPIKNNGVADVAWILMAHDLKSGPSGWSMRDVDEKLLNTDVENIALFNDSFEALEATNYI